MPTIVIKSDSSYLGDDPFPPSHCEFDNFSDSSVEGGQIM
jgi:hypothetical protein